MKTHIIKFWHHNEAIVEMYPPVLGNGVTMDWVQKERDLRNAFDTGKYRLSTVLKCPGIFELYNRGFFIQMPYDISFIYNNADKEVYYEHPKMEGFLGEGAEKYYPKIKSFQTSFHIKQDDFLVGFPFREDQLKYICNIKTGFRLLSPVPLLMMSIPYDDQNEWESSNGVLETNKNIEVNPQIYLNNYHGEDEKRWNIQAGDNVMFCIPLTHEKWIIENELSIKEKMWIEAYRITMMRSNVLCPFDEVNARYSQVLPRMKKKLNDFFHKLWD